MKQKGKKDVPHDKSQNSKVWGKGDDLNVCFVNPGSQPALKKWQGSFWMMINPTKIMVVRKPTYKKWWPRTSRVNTFTLWKLMNSSMKQPLQVKMSLCFGGKMYE